MGLEVEGVWDPEKMDLGVAIGEEGVQEEDLVRVWAKALVRVVYRVENGGEGKGYRMGHPVEEVVDMEVEGEGGLEVEEADIEEVKPDIIPITPLSRMSAAFSLEYYICFYARFCDISEANEILSPASYLLSGQSYPSISNGWEGIVS